MRCSPGIPGRRASDPTGGSSGATGALAAVGDLLPLGFAFAAGLVSAVNPCGFVLLPAYLGVFLGESERDEGAAVDTPGRVRRGLVVGLTLTAGFVVPFVAIGLAIGSVVRFLVDLLPWLGLAVGVGLIVALAATASLVARLTARSPSSCRYD